MISDDELLLYYYRDGLEPADRERIGAALAAQPELARRLHALVARLDAVAATPEEEVPAHTQERWRAALDRASTETRVAPMRRRSFLSQPWIAAAAAVAVVALVFVINEVRTPAPATAPVIATTEEPATGQSAAEEAGATAYERGLRFHLASTERQLADLEQATPEERARLVDAIIGQNRIYALAAERAGEPQLARVLRAFTPVLQEAASGEGDVSATSLAQLNFELRIMQARLNAGAASPNTL